MDRAEFKSSRQRSAEIWSVFAKHNFYVSGFTPQELRTTLEDLGPTYVKIGQIMSSRSDLLPESYCTELKKLRSDVTPMDAATARAVIEEETGKKIEDLFREFRDKPLGAASIAQAHYAVLLDGTQVVTKVQRPGVAEMMQRDFVLLKKLAAAVNVAAEVEEGAGIVDFVSVLEELEKVTRSELDFRIEAENTRLFRDNCIDDPNVISCPEIIDGLSTKRILTMTYVDGCSIADRETVDANGWDRTVIGKAIVENYMHQVLDVGIFHADPHQGNIMISRGVPCWIDFGMIGRVSEQSVELLQEMVTAVLRKDPDALVAAVLAVGVTKGPVNRTRLTEDVAALLERYAAFKHIKDLDLGGVLTDLTGTMAAHRISMPGEYTLLARSLVTVEGVLEEFCPDLDVMDFLAKKMLARARDNFNLKSKIVETLESLASTGSKVFHLPSTAFGVLQNLAKGRLKINFELTGYEDLLKQLTQMVKNAILAAFSCVLFSGSCRLCTANIQPQLDGVPLVAVLGFVFSIALALYTVWSFTRKK